MAFRNHDRAIQVTGLGPDGRGHGPDLGAEASQRIVADLVGDQVDELQPPTQYTSP